MSIKDDTSRLDLLLEGVFNSYFSFQNLQRSIIYHKLFQLSSINRLNNKYFHIIKEKANLLNIYNNNLSQSHIDIKVKKMLYYLSIFTYKLSKIHFLKDFIVQFVSHFKFEELILFEFIILFLINFSYFWFKTYPLPPLDEIVYIESVTNQLLRKSKDNKSYKLKLLLWRLNYSLFKDIFNKDQFLSFIDYCGLNKNNPSIILYFSISIVICLFKYCGLKLKYNNSDIENLNELLYNNIIHESFRLQNISIMKKAYLLTNNIRKQYKYPYNQDKLDIFQSKQWETDVNKIKHIVSLDFLGVINDIREDFYMEV